MAISLWCSMKFCTVPFKYPRYRSLIPGVTFGRTGHSSVRDYFLCNIVVPPLVQLPAHAITHLTDLAELVVGSARFLRESCSSTRSIFPCRMTRRKARRRSMKGATQCGPTSEPINGAFMRLARCSKGRRDAQGKSCYYHAGGIRLLVPRRGYQTAAFM